MILTIGSLICAQISNTANLGTTPHTKEEEEEEEEEDVIPRARKINRYNYSCFFFLFFYCHIKKTQ